MESLPYLSRWRLRTVSNCFKLCSYLSGKRPHENLGEQSAESADCQPRTAEARIERARLESGTVTSLSTNPPSVGLSLLGNLY
jgi:hypothetical protein